MDYFSALSAASALQGTDYLSLESWSNERETCLLLLSSFYSWKLDNVDNCGLLNEAFYTAS